MNTKVTLTKRVLSLYLDGFKNLKVGKTLWKLIFFKLLIMFGVIKLFFFNDSLNSKFEKDEDKSSFVLENLTKETKWVK